MSGYASMREVREVIVSSLEMEGRNPERYNIDGIARDAFYDRGSVYGYGARGAEAWRRAVEEHRRPFVIGDMVRVVILDAEGLAEHHYGKIDRFVKADRMPYRRQVAKPHSAHVELIERYSGWWGPLTEVTPAVDDFEIITDHFEVHRGACEWQSWYYKCLRCGGHTYKAAELMVVHKVTRNRVRLCQGCYSPEELARAGHELMWAQRRSKAEIIRLRECPELLTGPLGDEECDQARDWAEVFPYFLSEQARQMYATWKEENRTPAA